MSAKLSSEFKSQVVKTILSIVLFVFTYIILLAFAIGLTIISVTGAVLLVKSKPSYITLMLGLGLASLGFLVFYFLIKFIFTTNKVDRSHLIEIKKTDEPKLFQLIYDIAEKANTSKPKKVYLSSDVNASVFYDSSFWSMFLPIRKNLQIGLGLVNCVNQEELKAILAHEFGHFSQKSMKVGSYVYNVNQIIYNMLYENSSYERTVDSWSRLSGFVSFFVAMAISINEEIQWILKKLYEVINKSYLGLSREMEFHADEIAASITGFEPLKSSLQRLSFADHSLNTVFSFYNSKLDENKVAENIYNDHLHVMNFMAEESDRPIIDKIPIISIEDSSKFNKSKLVFSDQWASHPSLQDRIYRLEKTGYNASRKEPVHANNLFTDIEKTQKQMTEMLFKNIEFKNNKTIIPFETFQEEFNKKFIENTFNKKYNCYYDDKNPEFFDLNNIDNTQTNQKFDDLFSDQKVELVYTLVSLESDLSTIKLLTDNNTDVKTFDYDGKKYKIKETESLIKKLENESIKLKEEIEKNDIAIYKYFKSLEKSDNRLYELYSQLFEYDKGVEPKTGLIRNIMDNLQFVSVTTPIPQIYSNFEIIKSQESDLKKGINEFINNETIKKEIDTDVLASFEKYLSQDWVYFESDRYNDKNLSFLTEVIDNYLSVIYKVYFINKKNILNYQLELLNN